MNILNFSKANCKNCYKCLRSCPVKAIKIKNEQAEIVSEKCIGCGNCFRVCPQNARKIKSDLEKVKDAIKDGKKVIASVAPSYVGAFNMKTVGQFATGLLKLGFSIVEETAIGAEIVSEIYKNKIEKNDKRIHITTCCPAANDLIENYYPKLVDFMLPVVSPMIAHGKIIKEKHGRDSYVVFIGPCIAKKLEAVDFRHNDTVDAVITFDELEEWFHNNKIELDHLDESDFNKGSFKRGRAYPLESVLNDENVSREYEILKVSGIENCIETLESIENNYLDKVCLEINTCNGSCIKGPAMTGKNFYKVKNAVKDYVNEAKEKETFENFNCKNFNKKFLDKSPMKKEASEEDINEILRKIGKYEKNDELNCGGCGYNTCREKAQAVYEGMAELNMCLPFMRSKAEGLTNVIFEHSPNGIILINNDLKIKELNNKAEKLFHIKAHEVKNKPVQVILEDELFRRVLNTKESIIGKKIYYKEYNIVLFQSIIYLEKENILLAIMTNITEEEKHKQELTLVKENTIDAAQKVIEKQMRVAQEIASLLGETTAETKGILTKLKKIVLQENGDYR
ncbi:[Fe-Fe] hydrogenase large subunit C-terminal domain-containing protein [Anaeromicrobium sediminis]|uniref:Hydrogenase n=1 Tax=Anaeromicrobium sediminis TaxID=1478221 RepID=A0A267MF56_9FIRM|nr:[Fe-Fe] hydrogenase large subunit C-terminal domain-containing protein [Anaeromicrobium sediminis]PAB58211.1 hydrogenase [Anaeromicrobium sediminis]